MNNVLVYSDEIASVEYTAGHPFKPMRGKHMMELLNRYSLLGRPDQVVVPPVPLDEELLYLAHTHYYMDLLRRADEGDFRLEMLEAGLGTGDNPIFPGMYKFALTASGGTYLGAQMLLDGRARFVFNPVGGFHHAGKDHAGGFCYINDIAIAIQELMRHGKRVAYIDIDVHHGNGVESIFYTTDKVLKISLHESGTTLYPWSGFENEIGEEEGTGYNVNIPLLKGTDDEVYIYAFESVVPPLVRKFNPDVVFTLVGGDTHMEDPLAHMQLTTNGYKRVIEQIKGLAPLILAAGGGGYNVYKTAALWALAWSVFCGVVPVDHYAGVVGGMMFGPEVHAGRLEDEPFVTHGAEKDACFAHAGEVVGFIKKNVFPLHGLE